MAIVTEKLRPISWSHGGWAGLVTNVDEPFSSPDGSTVSVDQTDAPATFSFSDLVNFRDGIDTVTRITLSLRTLVSAPQDVFLTLYESSSGSVKTVLDTLSFGVSVAQRDVFVNNSYSKAAWSALYVGTSSAPVNSIQIGLELDSPATLFALDTIEITVQYETPASIIISPDQGELILGNKVPIATKADFISTPNDTLTLSLKDSEFLRADTVYPDPTFVLLNTEVQPLAFTYPITKVATALAGQVPVLSQVQKPAIDALALAGKVPELTQTKNIGKGIPRSELYLWGQYSGDADTGLPGRLRVDLEGQVPVLKRDWVITPEASDLRVAAPANFEVIYPESWVPGGWSGDITNIAERGDADGLTISADQNDQVCLVDFTDVENIRDGVDTITEVGLTLKLKASAETKLYMFMQIDGVVSALTTFTASEEYVTYNFPPSIWASFFAGTDTGPINSIQLTMYVLDPDTTLEIDLLNIQVYYESLIFTQPILDFGYLLDKGQLPLTGKNSESFRSEDIGPTGTATLAGKTITLNYGSLPSAGQLRLVSPRDLPVPAAALVIASEAPNIGEIIPDAGTVRLTGKRPKLVFGTVLLPGDHGIMSLSSRYDIEHIATPTDEIEL